MVNYDELIGFAYKNGFKDLPLESIFVTKDNYVSYNIHEIDKHHINRCYNLLSLLYKNDYILVDSLLINKLKTVYISGYYLYSENIKKYVYISKDGICSMPFSIRHIFPYFMYIARLSETNIPAIKSKCILYSQDIIKDKSGFDIFNDIVTKEDFTGPINYINEEENRFNWIESAYIFTEKIDNEALNNISAYIKPYDNVRLIGTSNWKTIFNNYKLVIITWEIIKEY